MVEVASEVVVVVEKEVEKKEERPRETGSDRVAVSPRGVACARSRPTQVDAWTIVRPVRDDLRIWNMKRALWCRNERRSRVLKFTCRKFLLDLIQVKVFFELQAISLSSSL